MEADYVSFPVLKAIQCIFLLIQNASGVCLTSFKPYDCLWSVNSGCCAEHSVPTSDKAFNKDTTVGTTEDKWLAENKAVWQWCRYTHKQLFTCSLMEQAEFGEERSSISDPLDPDEVTLIWSAGSFLDPSLTVRRLKTKINQFGSKKGYYIIYFPLSCVSKLHTTNLIDLFHVHN